MATTKKAAKPKSKAAIRKDAREDLYLARAKMNAALQAVQVAFMRRKAATAYDSEMVKREKVAVAEKNLTEAIASYEASRETFDKARVKAKKVL